MSGWKPFCVASAPSSRGADGGPVMNCNDAREGLSVLSRHGMGLTEWVLADAHVRQCVECRKALENLQEVVSAGQRVAPHRALQRSLNAMIDAIRFGTTGIAALVSRVRALLSISFTVLRLKVAGVTRAGRVWGLLTQVRLPNISELSARAAVIVVAGTGFVIARCADVLGWPRSFPRVTRAAVGATVFGRAAAGLTGRVVTSFAHRLLWGCSSLRVLFQRAARAAFEVARTAVRLSERASSNAAEATRFVIPLTGRRIVVGHARVRRVVDRFMRVDLPRVLAFPERAGAAAIEATWVIGRMVLTTSRHAVRLLGRRAWTAPIPQGDGNSATAIGRLSRSVRALATWRLSSTAMPWAPSLSKGHRLGLRTGVVCLTAVVAVALFLWPRPRPADLAAHAPAPPSQHSRQPADPALAELVIVTPRAETSIANSISSLETVPHARPKTHREAIRPRLPEAQAAIPAPSRTREPGRARDSASASVPKPRGSGPPLRSPEPPGIQQTEGSDGSAAIDWLVKREKPGRPESP